MRPRSAPQPPKGVSQQQQQQHPTRGVHRVGDRQWEAIQLHRRVANRQAAISDVAQRQQIDARRHEATVQQWELGPLSDKKSTVVFLSDIIDHHPSGGGAGHADAAQHHSQRPRGALVPRVNPASSQVLAHGKRGKERREGVPKRNKRPSNLKLQILRERKAAFQQLEVGGSLPRVHDDPHNNDDDGDGGVKLVDNEEMPRAQAMVTTDAVDGSSGGCITVDPPTAAAVVDGAAPPITAAATSSVGVVHNAREIISSLANDMLELRAVSEKIRSLLKMQKKQQTQTTASLADAASATAASSTAGDELKALRKRQNALKRAIGNKRTSAAQQVAIADAASAATHDDVDEGTLRIATTDCTATNAATVAVAATSELGAPRRPQPPSTTVVVAPKRAGDGADDDGDALPTADEETSKILRRLNFFPPMTCYTTSRSSSFHQLAHLIDTRICGPPPPQRSGSNCGGASSSAAAASSSLRSVIRSYVDNILTQQLDDKMRALLGKLSTVQNKLRKEAAKSERASAKLKRQRRFVCGLRETLTGIPLHRVKLVLVAPDAEPVSRLNNNNNSGGSKKGQAHRDGDGGGYFLDDVIQKIVDAARAASVPCVFGLSRVGFARALTLQNARCTAVGVLSAEGAYDEFRSLVAEAAEARGRYLEIIQQQEEREKQRIQIHGAEEEGRSENPGEGQNEHDEEEIQQQQHHEEEMQPAADDGKDEVVQHTDGDEEVSLEEEHNEEEHNNSCTRDGAAAPPQTVDDKSHPTATTMAVADDDGPPIISQGESGESAAMVQQRRKRREETEQRAFQDAMGACLHCIQQALLRADSATAGDDEDEDEGIDSPPIISAVPWETSDEEEEDGGDEAQQQPHDDPNNDHPQPSSTDDH